MSGQGTPPQPPKAASSGGELNDEMLTNLMADMYDRPNPPVKILTQRDYRPRQLTTYMGVPVWVDPLLPKDAVMIEYADGRREPLNKMAARVVGAQRPTHPKVESDTGVTLEDTHA